MKINGFPLDIAPDLHLNRAGGRTQLRTDLSGVRRVVTLAGSGEPWKVTASSGGDLYISADDAQLIHELFVSGAEFSATFPGVMPGGADLVSERCVILDPPDLPPLWEAGSPIADWSDYSFTVTLLDT